MRLVIVTSFLGAQGDDARKKAPESGICPEHSYDRLVVDVVVTHVVTVWPLVVGAEQRWLASAGRPGPAGWRANTCVSSVYDGRPYKQYAQPF
jgi:hypothetical protein